MRATRDNPSIPAWRSDEQGSPDRSLDPPELEPAYFDHALQAWVLSRHRDILAVLRDERAAPASVKSGEAIAPANEELRVRLRAQTLETLSPVLLRQWRQALQPELRRLLQNLQEGEPVDVLAAYARPACLALAAIVTGISHHRAETLCEHARRVSAHAANPYDDSLRAPSEISQGKLHEGHFHAECEALRDSTFVAISQTIPCMLGNAWYALLQHPEQWRLVHEHPELTEQAVEELMRYAGLTRLIGREATEDLDIHGSMIRKGQRIILRILAGNRDPQRFHDPNSVDVTRPAAGHFALGAGAHSCVGASLIRMSLVTVTTPLLSRFSSAALARPVEWQGGAIFQSPQALWINLAL
jgi:cytochrome P450